MDRSFLQSCRFVSFFREWNACARRFPLHEAIIPAECISVALGSLTRCSRASAASLCPRFCGSRPMSTESGTVELNNYLQSKGKTATVSWDESWTGPRHDPVWTCVCKIDRTECSSGTGKNKHEARNKASRLALRTLMARESE